MLAWCWNNGINNSWNFIIEDITEKSNEFANYNDMLADLLSNCTNAEDEILNSQDNNVSIEEKKSAINNKISECQNSIEQINSLWGIDWDNSLQNEVVVVIEKIISYYSKLGELLPYSEITNPTNEETKKIASITDELNTIDNEISESNNTLLEIQNEFANNHGFVLEANIDYDNISSEENSINREEYWFPSEFLDAPVNPRLK